MNNYKPSSVMHKAEIIFSIMALCVLFAGAVADNCGPIFLPLKADLRHGRTIPVKLNRCVLYVRQNEVAQIKIFNHLWDLGVYLAFGAVVCHILEEGWFIETRFSKYHS